MRKARCFWRLDRWYYVDLAFEATGHGPTPLDAYTHFLNRANVFGVRKDAAPATFTGSGAAGSRENDPRGDNANEA